jgi:four helix bundle protein
VGVGGYVDPREVCLVQNFRRLRVWARAHQLVLEVYRATRDFPVRERYGITSQMRRAAVSIPANIAEGCGRRGNAEFAHFLSISMGSATELQYHLILARDLELVEAAPFALLDGKTAEVQMMLVALIRSLKTKN